MKSSLFKLLILFFTLNICIYAENLHKEQYFPENVFSKYIEEYYSDFFDKFDSNSLMSLKEGQNEIRFSCIDSMAVSYIIKVDWTKHSRNMELIVENNPVKRIKLKITKSELNELLKLLSKCDFYNQDSQKIITGARDGADYILETNIEGKYKVVSRWGPPYEDFMFNIHEFLVKKTGGQAVIISEGKRTWDSMEWIEE